MSHELPHLNLKTKTIRTIVILIVLIFATTIIPAIIIIIILTIISLCVDTGPTCVGRIFCLLSPL